MMKSLELQPTPENLFETYKSDAIGRNESLYHFVDILDLLDEAHSISLDGQWGSGKTFFVKQVKMIMDAVNPSVEKAEDSVLKSFEDSVLKKYPTRNFKPQVSIYYDAWEHDNDEDPLISVIYEIIQSVHSDYDFTKSKDVLSIFSNIADTLTGNNIVSLLNSIRKSEDVFTNTKDNRSLREKINEFLEYILPEHGERLVVFIDELDRCNPSYAVKLLERVKHYLNHEKVTFVLAINSLELQNTIKQHYGTNFNACMYLDRFFDMRLSLPPVDMLKFYNSIGFSYSRYAFDQLVNAVLQNYNFSLREAAKYIRMTRIAAFKPTHTENGYDCVFEEERGLKFCLLCIVPILIGLKMHDLALYADFIEERNVKPLLEILTKKEFEYFVSKSLLTEEENGMQSKVEIIKRHLQEFYNALFVQKYDFRDRQIYIGSIAITENVQKELMNTITLLSHFSDYSF